MRLALILSVLLHLLVVLVLMIGIPSLSPDTPTAAERPIIVSVVREAEQTAAPPPPREKTEPVRAKAKPAVDAPKLQEPIPPPPEERALQSPRPVTQIPPATPEPQVEKLVSPVPVSPVPVPPVPVIAEKEKTDDSTPQAEKAPTPVAKPKSTPKPQPKKEQPQKEERKKTPEKKADKPRTKSATNSFDALFRDNIEKFRKSAASKPAVKQKSAVPGKHIRQAAQATVSELDAIRAQIEQNWLYDRGAQGLEDMVVVLRVRLDPDGIVVSARLGAESEGRYRSDRAFRAVADSAVRAAYKSSPLTYPREKYQIFEDVVLRFRPRL